jgi:hypothetical protein
MQPVRPLATIGTNVAQIMTPWFPRRADNARFAYEVTTLFGHNPQLTVTVLHKNREDLGPGAELFVNWTSAGANFASGVAVGLKEMVRFAVSVELQDVEKEDDFGSAFYRILEPTWFDQASDTAP